MPYLVSISAPKLSSWTIASVSPVSTSTPTTGTATRRKPVQHRGSKPRVAATPSPPAAPARQARRRRRRHAGTPPAGVSHCGGAVAAWPLAASESPTPSMASAGQHARRSRSTGSAARTCRRPSPRSQSAATARGWCRARLSRAPAVARLVSGSSSRSRPCSPSEATALTMPIASAAMIAGAPSRPRRSRRRRTRRRRRRTARDRRRSAPARSGRQLTPIARRRRRGDRRHRADRKHQRSRRPGWPSAEITR